MNQEYLQLYQCIKDFQLDDRHAKFPFSQKLAKENRWSAEYTQRAIEEYKKFAFLAVVAGHTVTPSEQVDRVWHLHLLYTRSYWDDFCRNVLQIPLHHNPSLGGCKERAKFYHQYDRTLASYEFFFGQSPPTDIWSPAKVQFSGKTRVVLINTNQNWIIPKPSWDKLPKFSVDRSIMVIGLFALSTIITGCQSLLSSPYSPLNFTGPKFLVFYICIAILATILGRMIRHFFEWPELSSSKDSVDLDVYETAYLAGRDNRTIETAIVSLVKRGHLRPQPTTRTLELLKPLPDTSHPLERAIKAQIQLTQDFTQINSSTYIKDAINSIRAKLDGLGLFSLPDVKRSQMAQQLSALPIFMVLLLGIIKIFVGLWRGKPVSFLVFLCIVTVVIGLFFLTTPLFSKGDRILANLKAKHQYLNIPSLNPQELAIALFGIVLLSQNALQGLRQVFTPPRRSTSSSGDGGGGGGGGCDGCGGCGD
jgi:uncharacterized protein (TIGR04222 family)